MKKTLLFLAFLLGIALQSWAQYFTYTYEGQTLYYRIVDGNANVTNQRDSYGSPYYDTYPTGDLIIPSTVTYNGTTYSVTSIRYYAFANCSELTSVTIPTTVTSIGEGAFSSCTGLTSITIPNSVTSIGPIAFSSCTGLTSITIPDSVTSIDYSAFYNCTGLTSVTIGSSVTSIGFDAFRNCTGLTSVTIPNSVTSIGYKAFYNCAGLTSITIPNSVTTIGYSSFENCTGLTSVTLGDSLTSIEDSLFKNCTGLTSVTIGNSITSIDSRAFYGCSELTSITIPDSVTSVLREAFYNCTSLTTVNFNAKNCTVMGGTSSSYNVFGGCTSLATVNIGENVQSIPVNAFENCVGLTTVNFNARNCTVIGATYAYPNVFGECTSLATVTIGENVRSIPVNVFENCVGLTTVNFNATNCTTIGSSSSPVFSGCTAVATLNIGENVQRILSYAFNGCTGLTTVNFNATNCTTMGSSSSPVFSGYTSLTTLNIGENVQRIPEYAFKGCNRLTGAITIPTPITYIGENAFSGCTSLTTVNFNATNCTTMGSSSSPVFSGCTALTTLNIGDNVQRIPNNAFRGCNRLIGAITIPDSVRYIGDSAFYSCSGLNFTLNPSNSLSYIGDYPFYGCSGLNGYFNPSSPFYHIGNYAFHGRSGLSGSISLSDDLSSIGDCAFYNCSGLTGEIIIPNNVTSIGDSAFTNCSGITALTIGQSVTSIGYSAFKNCTSLTSVNYNATNCGSGYLNHPLFAGCTANATLNIGENVQIIPMNFFDNWTGLTGNVTIPNSVTEIGIAAFERCSNLTSVIIGDSVTSIGYGAFYYCSNLNTVFIGSSVTTIGSQAFSYCSGINEIHSRATEAPDIYYGYGMNYQYHTFGYVNTSAAIYIPCGSLQSYQTGWSCFSNYIEESGVTFNAVSDNEAKGSARIDSYPDCTNHLATVSANANDGYAFDHWSDGSTDNPHTLSVTSDMTITAYFGLAATVTVNSDNTTMGVGIGSGSYAIGGTATISAEANYGYHFTHWNDGNTENPRTINVTVDTSFTAFFEINQYTVNVVSGNTELGSVTGGGTFDYGTSITISAEVLAENHHFAHWQDGNTDNPRTITVTADTTYTAYFAIDEYTVTAVSDNSTMGTTSGSGSYAIGTTAIISANANTGYHFTQWNDGNNDNPRTVTVTCDTTYTAFFEADDFVITVLSDDPSMGTVSGGGIYAYGSTITITATPVDGYMFAYWQDDNNDNPRTITVTGDAEYVAHFYRPEGIDDVDETDNIKIYTRGNTIVIDLSGQQAAGSRQSIVVYDMLGRVIKTDAIKHSSNQTIIPVSGMGIYMVKIGDQPSRKVLVRP